MAGSPHLKTQQLADALGVSVSTVKRWVDSGDLLAAKTVGRHRLIPAESALAFARDRGLPESRLEEILGGAARPSRRRVGIDDRTRDALAAALGAGQSREAEELIEAAYGMAGAAAMGDGLIRPAMERIGHHWEFGVLDVFEEHRATQAVESAIHRILASSRRRAGSAGPLALGAAPEGDLYTLSGLLAELVLRDAGWDAVNLGPNLPLDSLARGVRQHRPRLVWLSVSSMTDPTRFLRDYRTLHNAAAATGAAIILGGRALNPDVRSKIPATAFGATLADLDRFARSHRDGPAETRSTN